MPPVIHLIFLLLSFCLFVLAAWRPTSPDWNRIIAAGLSLLVASMISW
jgi:hypothetical protein